MAKTHPYAWGTSGSCFMTHETVCAAVRALGGVLEASKALGVHPPRPIGTRAR
jgi:hypothetical protein